MEIMTMAQAMEIADELKYQWIKFHGYQSNSNMCEKMIIDVLAGLADGYTDLYVAFNGDQFYTVSLSYTTADQDARKLFEIEKSIGFDLHELPC